MPCLTQMGMATVRMRLPLPSRVGQDPPSLALLDGLDVELGQLVPPEGAANQQRQDHVVAFALERCAVGDSQQLLGLLAVQPVSQPGSLLTDVGDLGQGRGLLGPEHPALPRLSDHFADGGEPNVYSGGRVWLEELFVVAFLEIFVVCLACANDNRLGRRKPLTAIGVFAFS
jgi:hypothetical protein